MNILWQLSSPPFLVSLGRRRERVRVMLQAQTVHPFVQTLQNFFFWRERERERESVCVCCVLGLVTSEKYGITGTKPNLTFIFKSVKTLAGFVCADNFPLFCKFNIST